MRKTSLEGHSGDVTRLALSPDERILFSGARDHSVRLWDLAARVFLRALRCEDPNWFSSARGFMGSLPRGDITFLSAGLDGRLVVGSWDGCLRVFQVAESASMNRFFEEERSVDRLFEEERSVDRLFEERSVDRLFEERSVDGLFEKDISIGHLLRGDLDEECKETDTLLSSVTLSDVCPVIHDHP